MMMPLLKGLPCGLSSMIEKQPQMSLADAGAAEALDLGPVQPAHDRRVGVHREAVQRVFGEHDQVHGRQVAPRLADQRADAVGLPRQVLGRGDHGVLDLHQPDDHAIGRLVETT